MDFDSMNPNQQSLARSLKITKKVTCAVLDDHGREMGTFTAENGEIRIKFDYNLSMVSEKDEAEYLSKSVASTLQLCYIKNREAFNCYD